ncbi:MAG TPA: CopG family transcriptional regulator, partial [Gammaproteobacteria bacterium]|nr:CopG family transcriptional regulator [Gammaproteobacteria bacterium]
DQEHAAEAFIAGAKPQIEAPGESKKIPIMVRFDPALLRRVNEAAKHRGVSRSAWIQFTLSRALDQGEG